MNNSILNAITKISYLLLVLSLSLAAFGQNVRRFSTDGTTAPALEPGAPAGSYALSGFDNVNLFNGNLNFALPLLKMGGRGAAGFAINLKIEKKWRVEYYRVPTGYTSCQGQGCYMPVWGPEGQHYLPNPNWWSPDPGIGPGILVGRWGGLTRGNCTGGGGGGQLINTLSFITNDGSEISFKDDLSNGAPLTISGASCSSTIGNRGTAWHSINGEGATFISDAIIRDSDISGEYYPSGYLMTKDGTRSRIDSGKVSWTRDRNGNKLTFNRDTNGGLLSATDSLGRQVTFTNGLISYKGVGGVTRSIEIGYSNLGSLLRYDQTIQTYQQLWPTLNDASGSNYDPSGLVSYVKLPDGRYYRFYYNSYGELARVELPTGGAYEYDWSGTIVSTSPSSSNTTYKEIKRWVTAKRVYDNGGTGGGYTSRTPLGLPFYDYSNNTSTAWMTTYDANNILLSSERHYFHGGNFMPSASYEQAPYNEGKEFKTENGIKTTNQTWENRVHLNWYATQSSWDTTFAKEPANDPRVTESTTTLIENNQVSKVHTDYDDTYPYNNPKDVWEYDYATGAPGALLRRTHTEYLTTNNGYNYATDTNIHLRSLPKLIQVFDAGNVKKSETSVEYDVYSGTNHAPLVDRPGIVGLDSSYTPGKTTRGNVTGVTQWLDNPAGSISGYSQYDIAGNVVTSIDPKNNSDTVGYTDNFSNPANNIGTFAFATSMSTPIPDAAGTYASNTALSVSTKYDYDSGKAVSFTDANNQVTTMDYTGDALDRPKQVNKPDGGITTFTYGDGLGFGNLYVRTQNKLNATQWTDSYAYFDGLGRTKQTKSFEGGTTWSFKDTNYDALGRAYQVSNPYRTTATDWTTTTFDGTGRVTAVTSPDNAVVSTAYNGNQVVVSDQAGKKRMSETDGLGRLMKVWEITPTDTQTVPVSFPGQSFNAGYLTTYSYDTLDNLMTVNQQASTNGTNQNRSFVYDSLKRLKSATNPESGLISYVYDSNSNLQTKTDARGWTATYAYDALNRNTTVDYSGQGYTHYLRNYYDSATNGKGKIKEALEYSTQTGAVTQEKFQVTGYDVLGRPLGRNQLFYQGGAWSANYSVSKTYDLAGNTLSQNYPSSKAVNYTYDQAARLTGFTGNLGDNVTRTYSDNIVYNAASLMTQERLGVNALSANLGGLFLNKHYNKRLQNYDTRLGTNGGDEWTLNRGWLRMFYNSDQTDYNPVPSGAGNNGNLYRMDHFIPDNDAVSSWKMSSDYYAYDALNRLSAVQENQVNNGAETTTYRQENTFDRWGNRTINQTNTWYGAVWAEDALPTGAVAVGDADGWNWVTASPTPFSGTSSHQSANLAGLHQHYFYGATQTLTPAAGENLYAWVYLDPTSPPTEVMLQWNNGNWDHRAYWGANQLGWGENGTDSRRYMGALPATGGWVRLEVPAASVGLVGQPINGMAFSLFNGKATWDRAGKTPAAGSINQDKYTVDAANNRFTELAYDAAGTVTKDKVIGTGRMEYKYDAENHIVAAGINFVTNNTTPTSQYFYDAAGKRTRKLVSGVETWFVYGIDGELVAEYNANGAVSSPQKEYGYRSGQLLVVYDNTEPVADKKLQWMVADHLGTPRMVIDKTGSLSGIKRHDYLPFGEEIGANVGIRSAGNGYTADQIKQKFAEHERDLETGLDFMKARYYSSKQGRFTSADSPMGDFVKTNPQSMNRYEYVRNNPCRNVDKNGKCSAPAGLKAGQVGICLEAFIAAKELPSGGLIGLGDNREHTGDDATKTARVMVRAIISTDEKGLDAQKSEKIASSEFTTRPVESEYFDIPAGPISGSIPGSANTSVTFSNNNTELGEKDFGKGVDVTVAIANGTNGPQQLGRDLQSVGNLPGMISPIGGAGAVVEALSPSGTIDGNMTVRISGSGQVERIGKNTRGYPSYAGYSYTVGADGTISSKEIFRTNENVIDDLNKPLKP